MAQVNVTITEAEAELLEKLCEETGRTKSGLISEWTKQGLYKEIENRNKSYICIIQRKREDFRFLNGRPFTKSPPKSIIVQNTTSQSRIRSTSNRLQLKSFSLMNNLSRNEN